MLYNIDINECINKYLNCDNILLLRQTFKTNNKFKILENLKIIRNITEDDIVVFKDDKYLLILNLYIDNIISNNKLLKVSQSFTSSKNHVQNIFSLKSDEKSRVLILDYVEAHDELLIKCNSASTLLSIYSIIPNEEINKELIKTLESKITNNFTDISNNLEDLIDSFNFYIDSEFYNNKKIDTLRLKMLLILDEIRSIN